MKPRTLAVIIGIVAVVGLFFLFQPTGTEPFQLTNSSTDPVQEVEEIQGVTNSGTLTDELVALNTINRIDSTASVSYTEQHETGQDITEEILYTPSLTIQNKTTAETIQTTAYLEDYTAVKTRNNNQINYQLLPPQTQAEEFFKSSFLRSMINSLNMTVSTKATTEDSTYIFTATDTLPAQQSALHTYYDTSNIRSIETAKMTVTPEGLITGAQLDLRVFEDGQTKTISTMYTTDNTVKQITQPNWSIETYEENIIVSIQSHNTTTMQVTHQLGGTTPSGAQIQIQNPDGTDISTTIPKSFQQGDQIYLYTNTTGLQVTTSQTELPEESNGPLSREGTYTVILSTEQEGIMSVTSYQYYP